MVNLNGKLVDDSQALLPVSNRGFAYGDAVFETVRIVSGKILFWEDHYFRLMASMRILRMEIPMDFTMEFLQQQLLETANTTSSNHQTIRAKLTVYRNEGGFYTPNTNEVSYVITTQPLDSDFYLHQTTPYTVELFKDHYVHSGLLSTIKSTNKMVHILGGIFATENGYDNCLLLNEEKHVIEALNGNLFLVTGSTIKTPPISDGCLRGILRKQVLDMDKHLADYTIVEASISPFELQQADELFVTNVISGITSVTRYRKKEYKTDVAKDLTAKLNARIRLMS